MLLNCSNHPSAGWGEALLEAAKQFGEVKDLPFPQIEPAMTTAELRGLTDEYAKRIEALHPDAVMAAGEFTFLFMLVDRLLQDGIRVLCTCSRRETKEVMRPDGSTEKTAVFHFERFRPYEYYKGENA